MNKVLLRWRYDFADGKVAMGMWSNPGQNQANQAWFNNKEGLTRACIETKDLRTKEIKVVVDCPGQDFRTFQWVATAGVPSNFKGTAKPISRIMGLKILTRDEAVEIYHDGTGSRRKLTDGEKTTHFATYGK